MAGNHYCGDVFVAFCGRPTRLGVLGYDIVYDAVFRYQPNVLCNTRLSLRKGCQENVESPPGICHSVSCRNMDCL